MSSITFADGNKVTEYGKPYVIAEVNSSHNGDIEIAKKMVDVAVDAGCNCVKFQSWSAKSLYSETYYKKNPIAKRFIDKFSLSPESLKVIADYCHEKNIGFSSTPYSQEEVDFLTENCHVPFIKVSSMELNNPQYLKYIADKNIPLVVSTGMAEFEEIKKAVTAIESTGNKAIVLLHCVSLYPTPLKDANLNNIIGLRELFPCYPIGFSDHTVGDEAGIIACSLGAAVLEKHITLDATKIGLDNQMAAEPDVLKAYVHKCGLVCEALGKKTRELSQCEIDQRKNMRRSVVSTRKIMVGETFVLDDLNVKRPGTGFPPEKIDNIIGRTAKRNIEADVILTPEDIGII